ncbi:hypothetical protein [Bacillus sp. UNC41MFS5]|uniref:hypothetical protein n=1 Tax=Bacillus sp. UNC41MFS5 TaxID=1449046 RepID=UPI0012DBF740|nr:hypothetical protein [Bacillus sp. UNC41MFS5]
MSIVPVLTDKTRQAKGRNVRNTSSYGQNLPSGKGKCPQYRLLRTKPAKRQSEMSVILSIS